MFFQEGNAPIGKQTGLFTAFMWLGRLALPLQKLNIRARRMALYCILLILVWDLVPYLGLGFQQAARMHATTFWVTITTAQLLGVTDFWLEAAVLKRPSTPGCARMDFEQNTQRGANVSPKLWRTLSRFLLLVHDQLLSGWGYRRAVERHAVSFQKPVRLISFPAVVTSRTGDLYAEVRFNCRNPLRLKWHNTFSSGIFPHFCTDPWAN